MDYQIQINELSFSYDQKRILDTISLNFNRGQFISIVGPNGSGKSTLLKVISSVLKPQMGGVLLDCQNISKMNPKEIAKKLSVVPQNTALEFDFKVRDVVLMGRHPFVNKFRGETQKDMEIAEKSMKYTNTHHLAERRFMELSGGERQRVILAQALAQEPKALLLDEPISHLDLQHQVEILNLIKKMCVDSGLTVIAVLHDLNMASAYSDYIILMKEGKVCYQGTPYETLTAAHIKDIFSTDVLVSVSPMSGKPYIYTLTQPFIQKNHKKVHVICGGGSGTEVLKALYQGGFEISSGVLAVGDLDWQISKECSAEIAEEIPFVPISDEAYAANKALADKADFIILTDLYFGKANIRNLELLLEPEGAKKTVFIMGDESFGERDYTEGQAQGLYEKIKQNKKVRLIDKREWYQEFIKAGDIYDAE